MNKEKIVVLNSGGFDSTVLIHLLRKEQGEDCEIHSLFFNHGQRSLEQEMKWSKYHADKVGAVHHIITLPKFDWTKGNFYGEGYDYSTQYLEWRNLVFLSYAFSLAESIEAKEIYLATLKSHGYKDTSKKFLEAMGSIDDNIKVVAPFSDKEGKYLLVPIAFGLGIEPYTFHSCANPNSDGSCCGECLDCEDLDYVNEELTINTPFKAHRKYRAGSKEFTLACVENTVPWELRVLWNNDCQLKCKHCFYGFESMQGNRLLLTEFLEVTKQALDLGINSIHLGGKEPLYDDSVIEYISEVNKFRGEYEDLFLSLVTNGINFPKFAHRLKEAGLDKVFISADDIIGKDTSYVRSTSDKVVIDSIESAKKEGIDLEVFINVHKKNYDKLADIIKSLENLGVESVYITVLKNVGEAEANNLDRLTKEEFTKVWDSLVEYTSDNEEFFIGFGFGIYYTNMVMNEIPHIKEALEEILYTGDYWVTDFLSIDAEFHCSTYLEQITLTPDGYVLGCALDVSDTEYYTDKYAGNIRSNSLGNLIKIGKIHRNAKCNGEENLKRNECCPHECGF